MTCTSPPELDEVELLAHLAGEADDEVGEHLEQCAHCNERFVTLSALENRLRAGLYRVDCPTSSELGEYHLGALLSDRDRAISAHVETCPHCQQELQQLEQFLEDPGARARESAVERVGVAIGRLLSAGEASEVAPAVVAVRGVDEGPMVYAAGNSLVSISAMPDPDSPAMLRVAGLLATSEPEGWKASLWKQAEQQHEGEVDDRGNFTFSGVSQDQYDLILSSDTEEILIPQVRVSQ